MIEWFIIIGALTLGIWLCLYESKESVKEYNPCEQGTCCHKKDPVEIDLKNLK